MFGAQPIANFTGEWSHLVWNSDGSLRDDFTIGQIPLRFEPKKLLAAILREIPPEAWTSKYGNSGWQAASLTGSTPDRVYMEESEQQLDFHPDGRFKGFNPRAAVERKFGSPIYHSLDELWLNFARYHIIKPRILKLHPGTVVASHIDGPNVLSVMAALNTNPNTGIFVAGALRKIPVDSFLYVMNAGINHHVFNFGDEYRYHLVFNLRPFDLPSPRALFENESTNVESRKIELRRTVRHTLESQLLIDGGYEFAKRLTADLHAKDVLEFHFIVSQEVVDREAFGTLLALICGLFFAEGRAFFLQSARESLRFPASEHGSIEFLKKITRFERASLQFRENVQEFLRNIS